MRIFTFFLLFFLSGCAKISVDKEQSLILKSYGYEKSLTHSQKTLQILKPKVQRNYLCKKGLKWDLCLSFLGGFTE